MIFIKVLEVRCFTYTYFQGRESDLNPIRKFMKLPEHTIYLKLLRAAKWTESWQNICTVAGPVCKLTSEMERSTNLLCFVFFFLCRSLDSCMLLHSKCQIIGEKGLGMCSWKKSLEFGLIEWLDKSGSDLVSLMLLVLGMRWFLYNIYFSHSRSYNDIKLFKSY